MRRWARLVDSYIEEYRARGISPSMFAVSGSETGESGKSSYSLELESPQVWG